MLGLVRSTLREFKEIVIYWFKIPFCVVRTQIWL